MDHKVDGTVEVIPSFTAFHELVVENIDYFPTFHYDKNELTDHRIRVFHNPPTTDIHYSERTLVRYITLADIINVTVNQDTVEPLTNGLCLLSGGELLRQNRFTGLTFVATTFNNHNFVQLGPGQVVDTTIKTTGGRGSWRTVINLLFPLTHEIGHFPESQELCPSAIHSDTIYETYSINFERVHHFTDDFDYTSSLSNTGSPLNLTTLRQETTSDFFTVTSMTFLTLRCATPGEQYPFDEVVSNILTFPLVMGLESMALKWDGNKRVLQETTLTIHYHYSLIIDNVRTYIKIQFQDKPNYTEIERYIDISVDNLVKGFDGFHGLTWDTFREYLRLCQRFTQYSNDEIIQLLHETKTDVRKSMTITEHLEILANDVHGYSINTENHEELRTYNRTLKTFDTFILQTKDTLLRH